MISPAQPLCKERSDEETAAGKTTERPGQEEETNDSKATENIQWTQIERNESGVRVWVRIS